MRVRLRDACMMSMVVRCKWCIVGVALWMVRGVWRVVCDVSAYLCLIVFCFVLCVCGTRQNTPAGRQQGRQIVTLQEKALEAVLNSTV